MKISIVCTDFKKSVSTYCNDDRLRFDLPKVISELAEENAKLKELWHFNFKDEFVS